VRLDHLLSKELHLGSSGVARVTGRHEVAGARGATFPAEDHSPASSGVWFLREPWGVVAFLNMWNRAQFRRDVGALLGPERTTCLPCGGLVFSLGSHSSAPRLWCWWWSAGVVVKCRVDASIFFLDLYRPCMPLGVRGLWFA
jgi:hypothetical protein